MKYIQKRSSIHRVIKLSEILIQILKNIKEAAAIISQHYDILYLNESFKNFINIQPDSSYSPQVNVLGQLNLEVREGKVVASKQEIKFPGIHHNFCAFVYLIDTSWNGEHYYFVLIRQTSEKRKSKEWASAAEHLIRPHRQGNIVKHQSLTPEFKALIGKDLNLKSALITAQQAAKSDLPIFIVGESGTGKELLARAIYKTSLRRDKPFVDVNCAAIPESLIESEFFGYEKGAFTGARTEGQIGYFDEANKGTLLLDEIGDASLQIQSKLLRVLEDGNFKRVGGTRNIKVDVRIISSTNRDVNNLITEKAFRMDLLYRLNTITINLPPLRERPNDIPLLLDHFLISNIEREKKNFKFHPSSIEILQNYQWPGNVRELKGVVNYAVNMVSGSIITPSSLPNFLFPKSASMIQNEKGAIPNVELSQTFSLSETLQNIEKGLIKQVLKESTTKTDAIRKLGISRRTFYTKIKQYGLDSGYKSD
jgi:transcriptional regulator with PAS, ATPase and Fis domain